MAGAASAGLDAEKKALAASERNEAARAAWREAVGTFDPQQFVFVDESSTHTSLTRLYGWAPHDRRATGAVPRNHGTNTTLVAALAPDGLPVPWLIEGAMETATFAWSIAEPLGPTLQPGQVVVLENAPHLPRQRHEFFRLSGAGRQRLLDKHMFPALERRPSKGVVRADRRRDHDRVHITRQHLVQVIRELS